MKKFKNIIDCLKYDAKSRRKEKFEVAKYVFNYQSDVSDARLIDGIIRNGEALAEKVNPGAANFGTVQRDKSRIQSNSIAGLLAEYIWIDFIRHHQIECQATIFDEAKKQIDIELTDTRKTIEVRSSFPRKGLKFALCHPIHQFDVIGPYINDYKPGEIKKDFYVRTLFPFQSNQLMDRIKQDGFEVYLTGKALDSFQMIDEFRHQTVF